MAVLRPSGREPGSTDNATDYSLLPADLPEGVLQVLIVDLKLRLKDMYEDPELPQRLYNYLQSYPAFMSISEMPDIGRIFLEYRLTINRSDGRDIFNLLQPLAEWGGEMFLHNLLNIERPYDTDVSPVSRPSMPDLGTITQRLNVVRETNKARREIARARRAAEIAANPIGEAGRMMSALGVGARWQGTRRPDYPTIGKETIWGTTLNVTTRGDRDAQYTRGPDVVTSIASEVARSLLMPSPETTTNETSTNMQGALAQASVTIGDAAKAIGQMAGALVRGIEAGIINGPAAPEPVPAAEEPAVPRNTRTLIESEVVVDLRSLRRARDL